MSINTVRLKPVVYSLLMYFISVASAGAEWSGYGGIEGRYFLQDPMESGQYDADMSLVFEPEFYHDWDGGDQSITFTPFVRLDRGDAKRTHFDIRELYWSKATPSWELRVGVNKVFWGVTEFVHLVDIINQTDLVEDIDTEDKLGQPMVNLALIRDWGTVNFFVMPWFRERTFPGKKGRLRTIPYVSEDMVQYESGAKQKHVDFAVRYSHSIGDWDIGVSHFYGTSRDPRLLPGLDRSGFPVLIPLYEIINQTSLDLQVTKGNMLWKLEALHRSGQGETYNALAGGFEYTFTGVFDTVADLGVLGEYYYDSRGENVPTAFEDDIAVGARIAFNDVQSSELLMGLVWDRNSAGKYFDLEGSRRFGNNWLVELQARFFLDFNKDDPVFNIKKDDYLELTVSYYF